MFTLVRNEGHYYEVVLDHVYRNTNIAIEEGQHISSRIYTRPYHFPCLIKLHTTLTGGNPFVTGIICDKRIAKSIVYPDTNNTNSTRWFRMVGDEAYHSVVNYLKILNSCTAVNHADMHMISAVVEAKQPYLLGYVATISPDNVRTLEVAILTKATAKSLVYFGKEKKEFAMTNSGYLKLKKSREKKYMPVKDYLEKIRGKNRDERVHDMAIMYNDLTKVKKQKESAVKKDRQTAEVAELAIKMVKDWHGDNEG